MDAADSQITCQPRHGFTLVELLAVLAVVAVLAALLLPVLSRATAKGQSTMCLNNLKQLQLGWMMYAHDNSDSLVPNISRRIGFEQVNVVLNGQVPWVLGSARVDTNSHNIEAGLLFAHVGSVAAYRCPSERSGPTGGAFVPTRSYSIHEFFNCDVISYSSLDNINDAPEWNYRKIGQIVDPGPSGTFVLIDEDDSSLDDGIFAIGNPSWHEGPPETVPHSWGSYPASRHNNGVTLSFADGHVDSHTWRARRSHPIYTGSPHYIRGDDTTNLEDLRWLQDRIPHAH